MDISTILGLLVGLILLTVAVAYGGDLIVYLHPQGLMIVLGGSACATLAAHPWRRVKMLPAVFSKTMFHRPATPAETVDFLVHLADVARRDGILALEGLADKVDDPFLLRGIEMAVDGHEPEVMESMLQMELESLVERHEAGRGLFESLGRYSPAFGMIGTLIGLVAMLDSMRDPARIGAGMATALLTTLYGAVLANLVFLPLADKLGQRSNEEILTKTMIIHGVMAIQGGDNPRNVHHKLMTFIPPARRGDTFDPAEHRRIAA